MPPAGMAHLQAEQLFLGHTLVASKARAVALLPRRGAGAPKLILQDSTVMSQKHHAADDDRGCATLPFA